MVYNVAEATVYFIVTNLYPPLQPLRVSGPGRSLDSLLRVCIQTGNLYFISGNSNFGLLIIYFLNFTPCRTTIADLLSRKTDYIVLHVQYYI